MELWNDTCGHHFDIKLPCRSISDLTITLRNDIGNRRLDQALCPA